MKKTIYKSIIVLEILHDEPVNMGGVTMDDVIYQIDVAKSNIPLKGIRAVRAIQAQGSDPDFFRMDEKGNEINED